MFSLTTPIPSVIILCKLLSIDSFYTLDLADLAVLKDTAITEVLITVILALLTCFLEIVSDLIDLENSGSS